MENQLINRIANCELTKSQIRIANYIIKNQKRITGMTAKQAGAEVGVSDATIIRFSREIGYEGFADLRESLRQELKKSGEKIGKHSLFDRYVMQLQKYSPDERSENEILQLMSINLESSIRQNGTELYEQAAEQILRARKKTIVGLRGGKGCALQFARLLSHIADDVQCITEEGYDGICQLASLGEEDLVICLNFSRYYQIDKKIESIIEKNHIPCCLITDSVASPIAHCAKYVIIVETEHCGFFHSMIGVEAVLEYLMILMCWRKPDVFRQKLKERDSILNEYQMENKSTFSL